MSTKSTLVYGPNFHLYQDMLDDGCVFLELEGVSYETRPGGVNVRIPLATWEIVRQHTNGELKITHLTDDEIQAHVEREVDKRLTRYEQAEQNAAALGLSGVLAYGPVESPRESQIAAGVSYFKRLRARRNGTPPNDSTPQTAS